MRSKATTAEREGGAPRRKKKLAAPSLSRDNVMQSARAVSRAAARVIAAHDGPAAVPAKSRAKAAATARGEGARPQAAATLRRQPRMG